MDHLEGPRHPAPNGADRSPHERCPLGAAHHLASIAAEPAKLVVDVARELLPESRGRESERTLSTGDGRKPRLLPLEQHDGLTQPLGCGVVEEDPGRMGMVDPPDGLQSTPLPECNDRGPAGLGLQWRDPEVLLSREDEGAAPAQVISQHLKRLM